MTIKTENSIKGLDLCRGYWEEIGRPAFEKACPELLHEAAFGLVGEGSDCFGYDDDISRDHDWGPGFCIWLDRNAYRKYADTARAVYADLPMVYKGYQRMALNKQTEDRLGVQELEDFLGRYIGRERMPESLDDWRAMLEAGLSLLTNGEVFEDAPGVFTEIRKQLTAYYPEDLRRKKLASACAGAGQSGQYNYYRCVRRGETVAAYHALSEYITQCEKIVFLLNCRYEPYYKWSHRALRELPILGGEAGELIRRLAEGQEENGRLIEELAALLIGEMQSQGLSDSGSDFLLHHGQSVQSKISDPALRAMHLMAE